MESFDHQKTHKKYVESLKRTGKQCVLGASGDDLPPRPDITTPPTTPTPGRQQTLGARRLVDKERQDARRRIPDPLEILRRCSRPTAPRREPSEQAARCRSAPGGIPASPIPTRSTTPLRHAKVFQTPVAQNPPQPFDRVFPRAQSASAHAIARSERIGRRRDRG